MQSASLGCYLMLKIRNIVRKRGTYKKYKKKLEEESNSYYRIKANKQIMILLAIAYQVHIKLRFRFYYKILL